MPKARKDNKGRALRKGEVYQESKGMYIYTFTDPLGRRKYIYSKDLVKLREKEMKLLKDQLDGLDVYTAGKADVNFLFDRYINSRTDLRKTTMSNYRYLYDHYVRDSFGSKKITEVKFSDVMYFYMYLVDEVGLSVSTVDGVHRVLSPAFQLAVRDDLIRKNPTDEAMLSVKRTNHGKTGVRHALTLEQQRAFIGFIKENSQYHRWLPIFVVLLGTGCRVGEAVGLRWKDVDDDNEMISINHTVSYYRQRGDAEECAYIVNPPKTDASVRDIPMFPEVSEAFRMEKALQRATGVQCTAEIDGMSGFIFCNRYGNVHKANGLNRAIRRISEDYNLIEEVKAKREGREAVLLPPFTCHHLRHTFCTRLCETTTNIKVIQSIMGHADIKTTMNIYAEVQEGLKKETFNNISHELKLF